MKKRIIFWINDTDTILKGEKPEYGIGGANVQMAFWAHTFSKNNFKAYALTRTIKNNGLNIHGVHFIWHPVVRFIGFALNYITCFTLFTFIKPHYVFTRAKVGELNFLAIMSKLFRFKLVHMLASDDDVMVNEKTGKNSFQKAIQKVDFVIAQNQAQKDLYNKNFKPNQIPIIPNIWDEKLGENTLGKKQYDFIWVANIGDNKRPLWFIQLAENLPQYKFALVGSPFNINLFNQCKTKASKLSNIDLLGYKSLFEVNDLVALSKVLVCTSIIEGFPNTFLQALSVNVPLLSTVDPNEIICKYKIGSFVQNEEELKIKALTLMTNDVKYNEYKSNIETYFKSTHSPDNNFKIIKNYIGF